MLTPSLRRSYGRPPERGQAGIFLALSLPVLFGLMGLVVDFGWAYWRKEAAKTAASAAASAVVASAGSTTPTAQASTACPSTIDTAKPWNVGCDFAIHNGFTNGVNNQTVKIQIGSGSTGIPLTGVAPSKYWVSATVTERIPALFSAVLGKSALNVTARSTVGVYGGTATGCIYLLDTNTDNSHPSTALKVTGTGGNAFCGFYVNGTSTGANAAFVMTGGTINLGSGGAKINLQGGTSSFSTSGGSITPAPQANDLTYNNAAISNPVSITAPSVVTDCSGGSQTYNTTITITNSMACDVTIKSGAIATIQPGVYGGFIIKGGSVTFNPGLYIIKDSNGVQISNSTGPDTGGYVHATGGVTFYFQNGAGTLAVTGGGLNLTAPTSGTCSGTSGCPGIAILKLGVPSGTSETWSWTGGNVNINGVVDTPYANMNYTGGSASVNQTLILNTFTFTGGNISAPATSTYLTGLGGSSNGTYLVE